MAKQIYPPSDDHFQKIYSGSHQDTMNYNALVKYEDRDNNLQKALFKQADFAQARILDVGVGTGRVSRQFREKATQIIGVDINIPMLRGGQKHQKPGFHLINGNALDLPVRSNWANVAISGWCIGHFAGWFDNWIELSDRALGEMKRVLKSGGVHIMIETLGTGFEKPTAPSDGLAAYYDRLENVHGFTREAIRTDYQFPDAATAARLIGFFFGDELKQRIIDENITRLIEWTGVWSRRV